MSPVINKQVVRRVSAKVARKYRLIPIEETEDLLTVAMEDPGHVIALDEVEMLVGKPVKAERWPSADIEKAIRKHYGVGAETVDRMIHENGQGGVAADISAREDISAEEMAQDASIIQFVNQIFMEAFRERASDIHIEPFENDLHIRYRIDGLLHQVPIPAAIVPYRFAIISRIKILANMNITERRMPQDGRIGLRVEDHDVDFRVSTVPTLEGESVVIRILDKSRRLIEIEHIGLLPDMLATLERLLKKPHGMILVTGPTGSGKSTTLYAALARLNATDRKILTIEEPVEYQLKGVNQIQANPKIGLTFAKGLRHIVRQDPDIIMVGEIRDKETAEIAVHAALTGHLVLSTLHTNDAAGAVTRLIDMGIEPFLVSSSVEAIVAQRLIRLVCPACKESYRPSAESLKEMRLPNGDHKPVTLARGKGCDQCRNTGYYERTGIYELLRMTEAIKALVVTRTPAHLIKEAARKEGMSTLRDDGLRKAKQGLVAVDEVMRVTQMEEVE